MIEPIKKLVVFDDDEDILFICKLLFEDLGWEVHTFTECTNAVDIVSRILPDAVIMDNWLPETGGVIAIQRLKKNSLVRTIPVMLMTANSEIEKLASIASADAYLKKPFDLDVLEQKVNGLLVKDRLCRS
ncbi:response regulator [Mucilaginibacter terrenus]|uniref:Response regulator n=1 Tax=Mucilaginibacter terrenus TaxID=2482727 RepID=A0A3E2NVY6_9SPHI|nr:response regulator [Mucilaginibacter terrenus]RFZ85174.1 response regulator [Mucilaginibacter terrenus]